MYEQEVDGSMGYSEFRRLVLEKMNEQPIVTESFQDEDNVDLSTDAPYPAVGSVSSDQFRCSSWESGLQLSSIKDIGNAPILWFYNIIGNRLQTLRQYFSYGNLVFIHYLTRLSFPLLS